MGAITKLNNIHASALAHISLLDDFIRVTQDKLSGHTDPFVRESLTEVLEALRAERQGYVNLLSATPLLRAA